MSHLRSVWLVRHGQTDWNVSRRYMSFSDRGLTPFGQMQTHALARVLASRKVDVIVHSGLSRTEQTALAIKGKRDSPVVCDGRWREASHGAWEGLTYREVMQRFREDALQRFDDPVNHAPLQGESLAHMSERVLAAWHDLSERFPRQRIVVVTHVGPIQALLCTLFNTPLREHWRWRIDLGSASGLDCYPSTTILRTVNHVPPIDRNHR